MINLTYVIAGHTPGAPAPELYKEATKRFAETYTAFPPGYEHKLHLINSNGGFTAEIAQYFSGIPHNVIVYRGSGWDIGAHQFAALTMPADEWVMCFNSWANFRRAGWLNSFIKARRIHGDGIYGATSSHERHPHIRSTAFFLRCSSMHRYPHGVNNRSASCDFEAGPNSISLWCIEQGLGAWLVTPGEVVSLADSRCVNNVFRRGDQSNIWVYDNYTQMYDVADEKSRLILTDVSDARLLAARQVKPQRILSQLLSMTRAGFR